MNEVLLLLGSNIGDRLLSLTTAEQEIQKSIGQITKRSKIYETASWGRKGLPSFLNKVIEVQSSLLPQEIMQKILKIETEMGRNREGKWESRLIDIDILFYGNEVVNLPDLIIPHPYLHQRMFTLVPLVEIAASKMHPVFQKTCQQLLAEVPDTLPVAEYIPPVAIK